jgi:hypothetical protein
MGPCLAAQALQAGLLAVTGTGSIGQAAPQMVTGTDCGVAQAQLSQGAAQAGVARDHLQKPVHTGTRGSEEGLLEHLRARRTIRRSRHASLKRNGLGQIKDAVSISERPASVEDRAMGLSGFPCAAGRLIIRPPWL